MPLWREGHGAGARPALGWPWSRTSLPTKPSQPTGVWGQAALPNLGVGPGLTLRKPRVHRPAGTYDRVSPSREAFGGKTWGPWWLRGAPLCSQRDKETRKLHTRLEGDQARPIGARSFWKDHYLGMEKKRSALRGQVQGLLVPILGLVSLLLTLFWCFNYVQLKMVRYIIEVHIEFLTMDFIKI